MAPNLFIKKNLVDKLCATEKYPKENRNPMSNAKQKARKIKLQRPESKVPGGPLTLAEQIRLASDGY